MSITGHSLRKSHVVAGIRNPYKNKKPEEIHVDRKSFHKACNDP